VGTIYNVLFVILYLTNYTKVSLH